MTDLSAQAAALVSQIETTSESITALGQQYDQAQLALQQAQQAAATDAANATALRSRIEQLKRLIDERAVSDYQASLAGQSLQTLNVGEAQQLASRARYAADQAAEENGTLQQLTSEQRTLPVSSKARSRPWCPSRPTASSSPR